VHEDVAKGEKQPSLFLAFLDPLSDTLKCVSLKIYIQVKQMHFKLRKIIFSEFENFWESYMG